jgi:hypothetical protein
MPFFKRLLAVLDHFEFLDDWDDKLGQVHKRLAKMTIIEIWSEASTFFK